jgi:predicted RNase H-like HicB family nuclease
MDKVDLSEKSVLFYDNGLFIELAIKLSKTYKKVYYYVPWKNSFPKRNLAQIGQGISGLERIYNFFNYIDKVDIIVFPDVYDGDLQEFLINKGYKVFGSNGGEDMELYREDMKEHMKSLNLPVNPYEVIVGIENLREYLKEHKNVWVKINLFRGEMETFHSVNYKYIEPFIDQLEYNMGPIKYIQEFIVEEAIDNAVEIGYDGYTIDGEFPTQSLAGIEIKDLGYIGKFLKYKDLPNVITDFNNAIKSTIKKYNYKGFYSTELRVGKDKKAYMIDLCARAGSPPNEVYQEMYTNLDQIVWYGAHGKCIDPIPKGKYALEVMIHSSWADKNWQPIEFPMKYRDNLKFRNLTIIKGRYYVVPCAVGLPEIGAIVAIGDTLDEAINKIKEIAETVKGHYIDIHIESLDSCIEESKKSKEFGLDLM